MRVNGRVLLRQLLVHVRLRTANVGRQPRRTGRVIFRFFTVRAAGAADRSVMTGRAGIRVQRIRGRNGMDDYKKQIQQEKARARRLNRIARMAQRRAKAAERKAARINKRTDRGR